MQTPRPARLLIGLLALASLPLLAADMSPQKLMQFGVEAARQGLWREALFRWERAVKGDASNARLRNNLAVAHESLGQLEEADRQYREALRLDPENRSIRDNHTSFLQMHPAFKEADAAVPAPANGHP